MKRYFLQMLPRIQPIVLSLLMVIGCQSPQPTAQPHVATDSVTPPKAPGEKPMRDTLTPARDNDPEPGLAEIMEDYRKTCSDTVKVDTIVTVGNKSWQIHLRHYSNGDSALSLPESVCKIYGFKQIVTSNFESHLTIRTDDHFLDTVIRKTIFRDSVDTFLQAHGTLLYVDVSYHPEYISLHYSYSIPLTDVGRGLSLQFR